MGETNETLMHVASMLHLSLSAMPGRSSCPTSSPRCGPRPIEAPWNLRLQTRMLMRQPVHRWVEDDEFDIDYHVRHSALPSPGGERELGVLVSRLHSNPLDFRRPPWELHIIEGLRATGSPPTSRSTTRSSTATPACGCSSAACRLDPDDRDHPFFFSLTKRRSGTTPRPTPSVTSRRSCAGSRRRSAPRRRWRRRSSRPSWAAGALDPCGDLVPGAVHRSSTAGSASRAGSPPSSTS